MGDDDERVRAFFALDLDDAPRRAAAEVARALRERPGGDAVRWVRPEALHVTLRFLGDVECGRVPELDDAVRAQLRGRKGFALELGAAGLFPSSRRPRVIALVLEPAERLAQLTGALERGLSKAGWPGEERPFRAHLTLGRVRAAAPRPGRDFPAVTPAVTPVAEAMDVREVVLFRSQLHPRGARYTPLARFPLADRPRGGPGGEPTGEDESRPATTTTTGPRT